jgi:hypothetical protein
VRQVESDCDSLNWLLSVFYSFLSLLSVRYFMRLLPSLFSLLIFHCIPLPHALPSSSVPTATLSQDKVSLPSNPLIVAAASNLSPEETRALILRLKIDELTKQIANPMAALKDIPEAERSPSPEPQVRAKKGTFLKWDFLVFEMAFCSFTFFEIFLVLSYFVAAFF